MIKIIFYPSLVALILSSGLLYFSTAFSEEGFLDEYRKGIEESDENRREEICREIKGLLPNRPDSAKKLIENELDKAQEREEGRWGYEGS
ncbi:hypothetical protein QWY79_01745 [Halomonas sabkhae]|uniref:hypothetical protein n=1 Tax=Halomonas sabkhae TaxID=626223 RepID=UPI0025B40BBC|nr:hypothetical protein [Halomonas sabkhae]MDN3523986.1 hypothetical protein [Halomonas sabkhae]